MIEQQHDRSPDVDLAHSPDVDLAQGVVQRRNSAEERRSAAEERRQRRLTRDRGLLAMAPERGGVRIGPVGGSGERAEVRDAPETRERQAHSLVEGPLGEDRRLDGRNQGQVQLLLKRAVEPRVKFDELSHVLRESARDQRAAAQAAAPKKKSLFWSALVFVVIPMGVSAWYYGLVASDQYVSEFRFAVTEAPATNSTNSFSTSPSTGGMSSLMGGLGLASNASNQNYIVSDYLVSRQAIEDIRGAGIDPAQLYGRDTIDMASRFRAPESEEKLVDYWQKMVTASYDPISGLASAQVRAFSAADAFNIASALVKQSESLVNRIANRSKADAVRFAQAEVDLSRRRLAEVRGRLDQYRTANGVIEPSAGFVTSNVQVAAALRGTLAQLETDYATLLSQKVTDTSPVITSTIARINATRQQIARVENEVSKDKNAKAALATVIADYEKIDLERQHAQTAIMSSMQLLDSARASAAAQSLYLTPYVMPAMPQTPRGPQRAIAVLAVGLAAFALWFVGLLIIRSLATR